MKKKRNLRKKAALELSMNFIVMLIIAIVIFSFSLYMIRNFFSGATTLQDTFDERTQKQIEQLLDDGGKVVIAFDRKTISNAKSDSFGIGIRNVIGDRAENDFFVSVKFNKAFDKQNNAMCLIPADCGEPDEWLQTTQHEGVKNAGIGKEITVRNNEKQLFLIGMNVKGAKSGTYVFNVKTCTGATDRQEDDTSGFCQAEFGPDNPDPYGNLKKIYVVVP